MTQIQKLYKNCIGELYDITITTLNNIFGRKKHDSTQLNGYTITIDDMIRELDYMGLNTQDDKSIKRDNRRNFLIICNENRYIKEFFKIYSNYLNGGSGFTPLEELNQACIIKNSGGNIITIFAHILAECLDEKKFKSEVLDKILVDKINEIKEKITSDFKKKIETFVNTVKDYGFSDLDFNMTILEKIKEDSEEEINPKPKRMRTSIGGTTSRTIQLAINEISKITENVNYGDIPKIKKYIEIIKNTDRELIEQLELNYEKVISHSKIVEGLIEKEITNQKEFQKKQVKEKLDKRKAKQEEKRRQEKQKEKAKQGKKQQQVTLITKRQKREKEQQQEEEKQQEKLISKIMKKNIKDGFLLFRIKTNHKVNKTKYNHEMKINELPYLLSDDLENTNIHDCNTQDFKKMGIRKNQLFKQTFQDSFLNKTDNEKCKNFLNFLKKEKDLLGFCKDMNIKLLVETLKDFKPETPEYILLLKYQHFLSEQMNMKIAMNYSGRIFTSEDIKSLNSILSNSRILNIFRDVFHTLLTGSNKNILSNLMGKINIFYAYYGVSENNFIQRINPTPLIKGEYMYHYLGDNCFIYDALLDNFKNLSYGVSIIETEVSIPYVLKEAYDSGIMDFVESHDEEYISPEDLTKAYESEIEKTNEEIKIHTTTTREKDKKKLMDEFKFLKEGEDPFTSEDVESLVDDILENKLFHGHYKEITHEDDVLDEDMPDLGPIDKAEGKLKKKSRTFGKIKKKLPKTLKKLENINKKVKKGLNKLRNTIKNKKNKLYNKFTRKNKNSSVKPKKRATIKKIANFFKNKRSKKVLIKKL